MNTELMKQQPQSIALQTAEEIGMTRATLELVKSVYAKGATDNELALFIRTAKRMGLDITARQIFLVKRGYGESQSMTIQVSIDGFRLVADRSGQYAPGREPTFTYDAKGNVESATAYVKKFVNGEWHEVAATAYFDEYCQRTREGKPNMMWAKMPRTMTAKCSEALALRKAFPAELSGVYTADEMGQAENPPDFTPSPISTDTPRPVTFSDDNRFQETDSSEQSEKVIFPENPVATSLMELVTAKQLGMIRAIGREIGIEPDEECQTVLSCKTDELSKKAASAFIQHLQDLQKQPPPQTRPSMEQAAEVIEGEVVEESPDEQFELIQQLEAKIKEVGGDDEESRKAILNGRNLDRMPKVKLREFLEDLNAI